MQGHLFLTASFIAAASSATTYPSINLGWYETKWEQVFVAWSPFTPTTKEQAVQLCDSKGAINGVAGWTAVSAYNYYINDHPVKPICRSPFSITDDKTNITYPNLELACEDDSIIQPEHPVVTSVVDMNTNKTVAKCTKLESGDGRYGPCTGYYTGSVSYTFVCS